MPGGSPFAALLARLRRDRRARPTVPIVVMGRDPGEGWRVLLMRGGIPVADLDAGQAERLAEQLLQAAATIGGKAW